MSSDTGEIEFESIEVTQVPDILDCSPDTSLPILLTQSAYDGPDAGLVELNRDIVNKVLDRGPSLDDISHDALRSYYVDMYAQLVAAGGLRAYLAVADGNVHRFVLQGLQLMDVPAHRDLLVNTINDHTQFDDTAFAEAFAAAEAQRPLVAANADYLRGLPERQVLSDNSFDVALDIRLGHVDSDTPAVDLPRWTGDVSIANR